MESGERLDPAGPGGEDHSANQRSAEAVFRRPPSPSSSASAAAARDNNETKASHLSPEVSKKEPGDKECCGVVQRISWEEVFFIATWGVFGAVARVYLGRILGGDCDAGDTGDFWDASSICITSNGLTSRRGGALFIDLPANILGSLLMGMLSASSEHPIPWFPADHHLQRHASFQKGLTTGFCGCLTTCKFATVPTVCLALSLDSPSNFPLFIVASWNTQMVAMLDGTNAENGPQVLSALFGYVIGILTAIAAFLWGRVVAHMLRNSSSDHAVHMNVARTFDEGDEHASSDCEDEPVGNASAEESASTSDHMSCPSDENNARGRADILGASLPDEHSIAEDSSTEASLMHLGGSVMYFGTLLVAIGLILGFVYGDVASGYPFYRRMWMACICTPIGAIARHQLKQWLPTSNSIQWGTWMANILGSVISVLLQALTVRFLADDQNDALLGTFLWALQVGFAGSLSTVSTFVKELVSLDRLLDRHLYGILTLLVAMSLGLAIYSPIVRS